MTGADDVIPCERVVQLLVDYLEDDLGDSARSRVDDHLRACPDCEEFLAQYKQTSVICREELRRSMPPALMERLVEYLRTTIEEETR